MATRVREIGAKKSRYFAFCGTTITVRLLRADIPRF
jgi:hypothetical protein